MLGFGEESRTALLEGKGGGEAEVEGRERERGGGKKEQRARHVFPFPRFIIRERERGTLIVRHNLLSANRRGVDVKHVQTRAGLYRCVSRLAAAPRAARFARFLGAVLD